MSGYRRSFPKGTSERMCALMSEARNISELKRAQCIYFRSEHGLSPQQIADMVGWHGQKPFADRPFGPVQAAKEYTGRSGNRVRNDRSLGQFEVQSGLNQLTRDFQQFNGERRKLFGGKAAMAVVHRLGQRMRNPRANPDPAMAVFSMPSFMAIASAVLNPMPRMSRARRYGFSVMT